MRDDQRVTIEDVLGDPPCFRLVWSVVNHWADVTAYEIAASEMDGTAMFNVKDWTNSGDWTTDHTKAEVYLTGYVKWDGCAELDQGKPHWCGAFGFSQHILLLQHIYCRAYALMGREPEDIWPLEIKDVIV